MRLKHRIYLSDVTLAAQDGTVGAAADIVFDSVDPEGLSD